MEDRGADMVSETEKTIKLYRDVLKTALWGWVILFVWLFRLSIISIKYPWREARPYIRAAEPYLQSLWMPALLVLFVSLVLYIVYIKRVFMNPALRALINDERVKLNRMKAFRFAFLTLIGLTVHWKFAETGWAFSFLPRQIMVPQGPWLVLFGSMTALLASFLHYNREAKQEKQRG